MAKRNKSSRSRRIALDRRHAAGVSGRRASRRLSLRSRSPWYCSCVLSLRSGQRGPMAIARRGCPEDWGKGTECRGDTDLPGGRAASGAGSASGGCRASPRSCGSAAGDVTSRTGGCLDFSVPAVVMPRQVVARSRPLSQQPEQLACQLRQTISCRLAGRNSGGRRDGEFSRQPTHEHVAPDAMVATRCRSPASGPLRGRQRRALFGGRPPLCTALQPALTIG